MSHYVKVRDGIVIDAIVAEEDFFTTFVDTTPGQWLKTSYNTRGGVHYDENGNPDGGVALRGNYAGIGFVYDPINDVFYPPRPIDSYGNVCNSWTISEPNWTWTAPIQPPNNEDAFKWNEQNQEWVKVTL